MRILISGATGFVGTSLVQKINDLHEIIALVRSSGDCLPLTVKQIIADNIFEAELPENIDVVIHLAGRAHVLNEVSKNPIDEFRKVNVEGTMQLARQALEKKVKRFIFMSSIGVNGATTGSVPFSENSQPKPHADYALSKYEAEQALIQLFQGTSTELVIIRPPLVYAVHAPGNFAKLLKLTATHLPLPFAHINNKRSFIALENLVDFIECCITHPKAANELFLIADSQAISTEQLVKYIKLGMQKPARLFYIPKTMAKLSAMLVGKQKLYEQLYESLEIDSSKAFQLLGWAPPLGIDQALKKVGGSYQVN